VITYSNDCYVLFLERCNTRSYRSSGKRLRSITYRLTASGSRTALFIQQTWPWNGLSSGACESCPTQMRQSEHFFFPHALIDPSWLLDNLRTGRRYSTNPWKCNVLQIRLSLCCIAYRFYWAVERTVSLLMRMQMHLCMTRFTQSSNPAYIDYL
jgi:hypothetical protein